MLSVKLTIEGYLPVAKAVEAEALALKGNEAIEAARIAREKDPEYIAMMQTQALYKKYGISLTDESLRLRMTKLLQQIDAGNRLPNEELIWLNTAAKNISRQSSEMHITVLKQISMPISIVVLDPWSAINASGHYRKSDLPAVALELIDSVQLDRLKHPKVRSAMFLVEA
jgi:hypothetical protein